MPTSLSSVYSSIDMNMHLSSAETIQDQCVGVQCQLNAGFDKQVQRLGARLASSAYEIYPDLQQRVPIFHFVVAEKSQPGTTSDASGTIIVYRGSRNGKLDEQVLAFLMAREMGHVVARHHDEKSAAGMLLSLVTQVFLPVVNVTRGIATLAGSAASVWGSDAVTRDNLTAQGSEVDQIAFELLGRQGWTVADLADSLSAYSQGLVENSWADDLRSATARCEKQRMLLAIAALQTPSVAPGSEAKEPKRVSPSFARIGAESTLAVPGLKLQ